MLKYRKKCFVLCMAAVLSVSFIGGENVIAEENWDETLSILRQVREAEKQLRESPRNEGREEVAEGLLQRHSDEIQKAAEEALPAAAVLLYWKARLHLLAGDSEAFRRMGAELAAGKTVAPEVWEGFIRTTDEREKQRQLEAKLGRLLPVSRYGQRRDTLESKSYFHVDAGQPIIPGDRGEQLKRIAELLERFGNPECVRDAWLEFIYGGHPARLTVRITRRDGWLSEATGDAWLRVAELEYKLTGIEKAAEYLAKAMIFGSEKHFRLGEEIIEDWKSDERELDIDEEISEVKMIAEDFKIEDIFELSMHHYRELNLHPRAVRLFQSLEEITGNKKLEVGKFPRPPRQPERLLEELDKATPAQIQEAFIAEWIDLVKHYNMGREKSILFGQPADIEEQIRNITIPPPVQQEVVKDLAEELQELLEDNQ